MKFDPNATEDRNFPVLPAGDYEFEVENMEHVTSRAGVLQWKATLRIDPLNAPSSKVWVYFPEKENMGWKFAQFFKSIGMGDVDDTGRMKDAIGEIGMCTLEIQPAEGPYPEKNSVKRFVPKAVKEEDLPF